MTCLVSILSLQIRHSAHDRNLLDNLGKFRAVLLGDFIELLELRDGTPSVSTGVVRP